jgi:Right handed beta helix region
MVRLLSSLRSLAPGRIVLTIVLLVFFVPSHGSTHARAQAASARSSAGDFSHAYYIDCSNPVAGDGSQAHPWNSLAAAQTRSFAPGDRIALARGTVCHGSFAPQGSGSQGRVIRLTAYGRGPRPRIAAPHSASQVLLLFNQQYWQIDSLDLSGAHTYGIFISGNQGPLTDIALKNLYVHTVFGGAMKNKDNGLVVIGPSGPAAVFNNVLIDGVDAAHTNQWAGILVGGGDFAYPPNASLNRGITIRNSTVHDVYGDGIVLFRDADSVIQSSAAWQTGMQPTQTIGTPNAIWTWTCDTCTVEDNEAYLTDSPGVDGGAYDIDWDNTRNIVQRNYAHDTEGYCIAVFAAGYVTSDSAVRDNLCVDNARSPRLAALQGAVYIHTWNGGVIRGLAFERNSIQWNPPVPDAAAIVNDAAFDGPPAVFAANRIASTSPLIYRITRPWTSSKNVYTLAGPPLFDAPGLQNASLATLHAKSYETGSSVQAAAKAVSSAAPLRLEAVLRPNLDQDGLLTAETRAQLVVLRSLAGQYEPSRLHVIVYLQGNAAGQPLSNAIHDLDSVYPGALHFKNAAAAAGAIRLVSPQGKALAEWQGFQNAATLGGAVRARLGQPDYSHMQAAITEGP